ncbi:MAG: 30S ribosomal protein S21 [candidate division KSB1 bacterium]|nr:30S ribosomal protein S21 [candidate division KSB1 bacterium]
MIQVIVGENESLDSALNRFRRKCEQAKLLQDIKRTSHYVKPSEQRRIEARKALRRLRRKMQKINQLSS